MKAGQNHIFVQNTIECNRNWDSNPTQSFKNNFIENEKKVRTSQIQMFIAPAINRMLKTFNNFRKEFDIEHSSLSLSVYAFIDSTALICCD